MHSAHHHPVHHHHSPAPPTSSGSIMAALTKEHGDHGHRKKHHGHSEEKHHRHHYHKKHSNKTKTPTVWLDANSSFGADSSSSSSSNDTETTTILPRPDTPQPVSPTIATATSKAHLDDPIMDNKDPVVILPPLTTTSSRAQSSAETPIHLTFARWCLILARFILLDAPLLFLCTTLCTILLLQQSYHTYLVPYMEHTMDLGDYDEDRGLYVDRLSHEFTYYNRQCHAEDILRAPQSANDLLVTSTTTPDQAADLMLQHGAVTLQNLLSSDTITALRAYLADKHEYRHELPYNENFWHDIGRLSLGLGVADDFSIGQALGELGQHAALKTALQGILGPDPALVEISTLTSLHGAEQQGIHTDSDWFGSSLLYSRTFYHSYSFFVALQDTPQRLGATTVCAGSHYCANEDLEAICVGQEDELDRNYTETPAFEVSTNGQLGPQEGLLRRGDGFLFHQNVWHRGPANRDDHGRDRIMFILTFVSSKPRQQVAFNAHGDHRRQALGTYYYQRWNMWSHTWSDLQEAGKTTLTQPVAALGALGLWKPTKARGSHEERTGITFIEQLCQQLANEQDFYGDDELEDLRDNFWNRHGVPEFLQSQKETWKEYIPDILTIWIEFVGRLYGMGLMLYLVTRPREQRQWWKRLGMMHGAIVMAFLLFYLLVINQCDLAKALRSGQAVKRAFADPRMIDENRHRPTGPTTFPERSDVLIATRFDADFLAAYNRFLDYHPGNALWLEHVRQWAQLPTRAMQEQAVQGALANARVTRGEPEKATTIFRTPFLKQSGMAARFLKQDYADGTWKVMSQEEAVEETQRAVWMASQPLLAALVTQAKQNLAQTRFGANRHTVLSKTFAQLFAQEWLDKLWSQSPTGLEDDHVQTTAVLPKQVESKPLVRPCQTTPCTTSHRAALVPMSQSHRSIPKTTTATAISSTMTSRRPTPAASDLPLYAVGDKIYLVDEDSIMIPHTVKKITQNEVLKTTSTPSSEYLVVDSDGEHDILPESDKDLQPFRPLQEGDAVEVDYNGNGKDYYKGRLLHMHPDGTATVRYFVDDEVQSGVLLERMVPVFGPKRRR